MATALSHGPYVADTTKQPLAYLQLSWPRYNIDYHVPKYAETALMSLLLAAASQTLQAADPDRLKFGALRFGMSLDDARAALPDARWTVTDQSSDTHRAYAIKFDHAVTLADVTFDAQIGSRYIGATDWKLEANDATPNAAACQDRVVPVVAELERRFGMFHHLSDVITGEALIRIGTASDGKISAAEKMRPLDPAKALRKDPQDFWFGARHDGGSEPDDLAVDARAHYERDNQHSCQITIEMKGREPRPAELPIVFDEARLLTRPTIAYRNGTLRALGAPEKPLKFVVPCRISAATGKVGVCVSRPSGANIDPYRKLAADWAIRFQLKLTNPQPDDQRYFDIDVPVTMGPDDMRAVDVSTGRRLEPALLIVTRGSRIDPDDVYTDDMRRLKTAADITVLCKVQEDGSVLCDIKPGTTSPAKDFTDAAIKLGERLEVETKLRDGASAVGGLIERRIKFAPPEAP